MGLFNLGMATGLEGGKFWIESVEILLKFNMLVRKVWIFTHLVFLKAFA